MKCFKKTNFECKSNQSQSAFEMTLLSSSAFFSIQVVSYMKPISNPIRSAVTHISQHTLHLQKGSESEERLKGVKVLNFILNDETQIK